MLLQVAKIIKQQNGFVLFKDENDNPIARVSPRATFTKIKGANGFVVEEIGRIRLELHFNFIQAYQILPAAEVPFSGDAWDLFDLLTDFMTPVVPTSSTDEHLNRSSVTGVTTTDALNSLFGGEVSAEENFVLVNGSYSVSVSAEPAMNDQNVIATGALTATLPPAVSDVFGIPITICANSNDVTILPDGTDLILSDTSCEIAGLDSITLICFQTGKWIAK